MASPPPRPAQGFQASHARLAGGQLLRRRSDLPLRGWQPPPQPPSRARPQALGAPGRFGHPCGPGRRLLRHRDLEEGDGIPPGLSNLAARRGRVRHSRGVWLRRGGSLGGSPLEPGRRPPLSGHRAGGARRGPADPRQSGRRRRPPAAAAGTRRGQRRRRRGDAARAERLGIRLALGLGPRAGAGRARVRLRLGRAAPGKSPVSALPAGDGLAVDREPPAGRRGGREPGSGRAGAVASRLGGFPAQRPPGSGHRRRSRGGSPAGAS